jgi:hypothetical protein
MNNSDNASAPASPTPYMDQTIEGGELYCDNSGLTKREHFAAMAMQGLLAGGYGMDDPANRLEDVSCEAVNLAGALLEALESKQ